MTDILLEDEGSGQWYPPDLLDVVQNLLRPKCQSPGLGLDADLNFQDKYLYSQGNSSNKQSTFVQVNY